MKCTHCGHSVEPGKFCANCGALSEYASDSTASTRESKVSYDNTTEKTQNSMDSTALVTKKALPLWVVVLPIAVLLIGVVVTLSFVSVDLEDLLSFGKNNTP